jgi:hypothetical protein
MYKNVPEMNKRINSYFPINRPNTTPIKHKILDTILKISARLIGIPAFLNTAKLPISCGNSWQKTAIAVVIPVVTPVANAAPIIEKWMRL